MKDFIAVALLTSQPYVLVSGKSSGITSVGELIAAAKAKRGELKIGSTGVGTGTQLGLVIPCVTIKKIRTGSCGFFLPRGSYPGEHRSEMRAPTTRNLRCRLQLGVFGAARMRITGAGVGILRRSLHVGLRALFCPPPCGMAFWIADLDAAALAMSFGATAETSGGLNRANHVGRVGEYGKGAGKKQNPQSK